MSKHDYINLLNIAKKIDHSKTLNEIKQYFGFLCDSNVIDDIALSLQICIKKSKPMYIHGYVITSALKKYIESDPNTEMQIFETGTARGFSAVCMAYIMNETKCNGNIITLDHSPLHKKAKWNCIHDFEEDGLKTRNEIVDIKYKTLHERFIKMKECDSIDYIQTNPDGIERINFAFLDGAHDYKSLKKELKFVECRQKEGDVIVVDDYTKSQFPEIVKAINEFVKEEKYEHKIFYADDGTKKRGYVYMIMKKNIN
tara:strand:+ start:10061 stop:10828 length:768 start_codon:yes stop_codon:yes gene_type:complete